MSLRQAGKIEAETFFGFGDAGQVSVTSTFYGD
jgi:hypothetical protein